MKSFVHPGVYVQLKNYHAINNLMKTLRMCYIKSEYAKHWKH